MPQFNKGDKVRFKEYDSIDKFMRVEDVKSVTINQNSNSSYKVPTTIIVVSCRLLYGDHSLVDYPAKDLEKIEE